MKEELLSELSDEELEPPEYYPIEYALMWVAYGCKPINQVYAKIIYDKPPLFIFNERLKKAETKLLTYLASGKISSVSMDYEQDDVGLYKATGEYSLLEKSLWENGFDWCTLTLNYKGMDKQYYEHTDIHVNTKELLKCLPLPQDEGKVKKFPPKPENDISQRERDTLLKLVIGMAVKGYAYDPKAARNSSIKDIADDLASLGISLDPDTVRKWVKEAAEILPRDDV